jgi:hypothetical protein
MSEFEKNVIDRLARIESYLENDSKEHYGNGKAGLLDKVNALDKRLVIMESKNEGKRSIVKDVAGVIAWLVAIGTGLYAIIRR